MIRTRRLSWRPILLAAPPLAAVLLLAWGVIRVLRQGEPAVPRVCPVCRMDGAPDRSLRLGGTTWFFCTMPGVDHREEFRRDPSRHLRAAALHDRTAARHRDPVCGMGVGDSFGLEHAGRPRYFCSARCRDLFAQDPSAALTDTCPVCRVRDGTRGLIDKDHAPMTPYRGQYFFFCGEPHRLAFEADPGTYFVHRMWGIPPWMFFAAGAGILVVTFAGLAWAGRREHRSGPLPEPAGDPWRIDLLGSGRWRRWLAHRATQSTAQAALVALFGLIIAAGLFGSQDSAENPAPILTWTLWWAGLTGLVLFSGHAWCAVCPWDALAGWLQKIPFFGRSRPFTIGLPWPRPLRNLALAIAGLVFMSWFELGFHASLSPRITALYALAILGAAAACAVVFERKSFCRYGCLVGRTVGMYALFGGIELRRREKSVCLSKCRTKDCFTGNARGQGCPTFEFPQVMEHNTYCLLCGECVRTCPHDNIGVFLRPPGADLARPLKARPSEAFLALLLLGVTAFHGLAMTPPGRELAGWFERAARTTPLGGYTLGMTVSLALPPVLFGALSWLGVRWAALRRGESKTEKAGAAYMHYAYSLLPVALAYHLAHSCQHMLAEGSKVFSLASDPFGLGWNLFGTAGVQYPPLMSLGSIWYVQVALILAGHVYGLFAADAIGRRLHSDPRRALWSQIPPAAALVLFSVFSLWLVMQPMEMRTSAM